MSGSCILMSCILVRSVNVNLHVLFTICLLGIHGEHTESVGGVYDISNKRRLGITEYQAVQEMAKGVTLLILLEKSLSKL